jgi:hypothetical protein
MRKILTLGLLFASISWAAAAQNVEQPFAYDRQAPLDAQVKSTTLIRQIIVPAPSLIRLPSGSGFPLRCDRA